MYKVYINSRNRISGTNSDFTHYVEFPDNFEPQYVGVLQCLIPKSYYLIEDNYNTFIVEENGVQRTITMTPGNYNRRSFASVLTTLLNTGTFVYTISYPSSTEADTGKFTFTVTNNSGIQPKFIFQTNVYEQMGFDPNSTNIFSANSLTSQNVIKMQSEDALFIHSDICQNYNENILQEIYSTAGSQYYSNIHFQNTSSKEYLKKFSRSKSNIYHFYLCDENAQPIDINGQNLLITLCIQ